MTTIPLPMSHEELVADYEKLKERLDRLEKMFEKHVHNIWVDNPHDKCSTPKFRSSEDYDG